MQSTYKSSLPDQATRVASAMSTRLRTSEILEANSVPSPLAANEGPSQTGGPPPGEQSAPLDLDLASVEEWLGSVPGQLSGTSSAEIALAQLERIVRLVPAPVPAPQMRKGAGQEIPNEPLLLLKNGGYSRSVRAWMRQIVGLTRRAESAEARLRALEEQLQTTHLQDIAWLGRRFGQRPHESFPAFVVRLGMTAKAQPLARASTSGSMSFSGSANVPLPGNATSRPADDTRS